MSNPNEQALLPPWHESFRPVSLILDEDQPPAEMTHREAITRLEAHIAVLEESLETDTPVAKEARLIELGLAMLAKDAIQSDAETGTSIQTWPSLHWAVDQALTNAMSQNVTTIWGTF